MSKVRRIVKIVLVSFAAVAGFLLLLIGGVLIYLAIDREDMFYLRNSEFANVDYFHHLESVGETAQRESIPVYAHRLKRGSGTIFAYRFYSNGGLATDGENYRKITMWLAGPLPTSLLEIPLGSDSRALLVYSYGGSVYPEHEFSGYGTSGTIRIEPTRGRFSVTIHADVSRAGITPGYYQSPERIDRTFKTGEIAFEDLTPWLGIPGHHPFDETFRP